jgi:hypothetical protein
VPIQRGVSLEAAAHAAERVLGTAARATPSDEPVATPA